jgi:hypothetical protein
MPALYAIGRFDDQGKFEHFERKGRNNAISGYDNLASAKRGLSQSRSGWSKEEIKNQFKIVKATGFEILDY